ncbi:MAG: hypothetical protein K8L99_10445 [Anaerolineae bacterium]|nr:hypothetical protein [Anaerolineae bacterium]
MTYRKFTLLASLALLLLISACRQEQAPPASDVDAQISLAMSSNTVGESVLMIAVTDSRLNSLSVNKLTVRGDMNHAGMVPVIAESEDGAGGQFEIPFEWTMGGDWTVEVTAELTDGQTVSDTFDVTVISDDGDMHMETDADMDMGDTMDATPTAESSG